MGQRSKVEVKDCTHLAHIKGGVCMSHVAKNTPKRYSSEGCINKRRRLTDRVGVYHELLLFLTITAFSLDRRHRWPWDT